MKILFLHGWHSVVGGVKPTHLKQAGHEVLNPALNDDDFDKAVRTAQAEYDQHKPDVIVGSSRGGAVAMNIDSEDTPLVLLCPAWKNWGSATTVKPNTVILHSRQDKVIPFVGSEELVRNSGLLPESLVEVGNDHRLADEEPLQAMLEECHRHKLQVVGIDPASSKGLVVWMDDSKSKVSARNASTWISQLCKVHRNLLICWDSPLSFNRATSLSDRPVEKVLRTQVQKWIDDGLIEQEPRKKAVSVQPFSGCSHWVISCEALGQPFGNSESRAIQVAPSCESIHSGGPWVVEAHPAVAMAVWWIERKETDPFPIYKKRPEACKRIAKTLGFEELNALERIDDDTLDAYVAHRLATEFMSGGCRWIGDHRNGGFILPNSAETNWGLHEKVNRTIQATTASVTLSDGKIKS
jgi:predicted RNase H-like nuclease